jgi:hypothetical protein
MNCHISQQVRHMQKEETYSDNSEQSSVEQFLATVPK